MVASSGCPELWCFDPGLDQYKIGIFDTQEEDVGSSQISLFLNVITIYKYYHNSHKLNKHFKQASLIKTTYSGCWDEYF